MKFAFFIICKNRGIAIVSNMIWTALHIKNNIPVNPFSAAALQIVDDVVGITFAGKPGTVSWTTFNAAFCKNQINVGVAAGNFFDLVILIS